MRAVLLALCLTVLASSSTRAQGGGFNAGDMYLYTVGINGPDGAASALVHVDHGAGTADVLVDTASATQGVGTVVWDAYRQRVLFRGSVAVGGPVRLWATDAAGQLDDLGNLPFAWKSMTSTGDGRIYLHAGGISAPFQYVDATNTLTTLMDVTGTVPFVLEGNPSFDVRGMIYDAGTNALFLATPTACTGGVINRINVRKLPLSVDGTRVVGPIGCAQFDVSSSGEEPVGWSRGPAGQLVLVADTNTNDQEPRMMLVDPGSLAITTFASNGIYAGAAATNAGTWCSSLGKVVILDTGTNVLRAFAPGESGTGAVLALDEPVSPNGGSHELAALIEVEPSSCDGAWMAYGAGLSGAGGVVPRLYGSGCPQVGGLPGLRIEGVVGGASGLLFVGLASAAVPFKGGSFLVGAVVHTLPVTLGGAPGVAGAGALTLPAGIPAAPVLENLNVYLQAGFADAAAVKDVSLSKGLRMTIGG